MKTRFAVILLMLVVGLSFLECRRPQSAGQDGGNGGAPIKLVRIGVSPDGTIFIQGTECPWPELTKRLKGTGDKENDLLTIEPTETGSDITGYESSILAAAGEAGWIHVGPASRR